MVDTHLHQNSVQDVLDYDREKELKDFDDTKAGVKGLVDNGIVKIPQMFVIPTNELSSETSYSGSTHLHIPVIDLKDIHEGGIVNHGISEDVMDEMMKGIHRFHEQPTEVKREYYLRDATKNVTYMSNFHLFKAKAANWRDSLSFSMAPVAPILRSFHQPAVKTNKKDDIHYKRIKLKLRKTNKILGEWGNNESSSIEQSPLMDIIISYSEHVKMLRLTLLELLSEALGLKPNHLIEMGCAAGHNFVCNCYPACPEPNRTMGASKRSDPDFFTILLQGQIGGLQLLYENQWADIPPVIGALVVNLGDLFQLISNDKSKSTIHRVLANQVGLRISVACFFSTHLQPVNQLYGPIKELLSDDNPPLYRETLVGEYAFSYALKGLGNAALALFRL
ncbi:hypothetical protein ACB092_03G098500 [Castanea dentata]